MRLKPTNKVIDLLKDIGIMVCGFTDYPNDNKVSLGFHSFITNIQMVKVVKIIGFLGVDMNHGALIFGGEAVEEF